VQKFLFLYSFFKAQVLLFCTTFYKIKYIRTYICVLIKVLVAEVCSCKFASSKFGKMLSISANSAEKELG